MSRSMTLTFQLPSAAPASMIAPKPTPPLARAPLSLPRTRRDALGFFGSCTTRTSQRRCWREAGCDRNSWRATRRAAVFAAHAARCSWLLWLMRDMDKSEAMLVGGRC